MTRVSYVNILRKNLKQSTRTMALRNFTFQQDSDPKHTCAIARQYFDTEKIAKLDWPSQSSEHLWFILDDKIPMSLRTNLERFWTAMQTNRLTYRVICC